MTTASRTWRICQYTTHTAKGLKKQTYNDERVRDPSDDVELLLERQREVAEHAAHHVDEHEHEGHAYDFLVLVDLVVLRSAMEYQRAGTRGIKSWAYLQKPTGQQDRANYSEKRDWRRIASVKRGLQ